MAALAEGTRAPGFKLTATDGKEYDLPEALRDNPYVVLVFLKVSCPVCQFALPYVERLYRSHPNVPIWGISQDDADATNAFARMYGCTFPMLLDERLSATVDYDLTNVPTIFTVESGGTIQQTIVGFNRSEMERLNLYLTGLTGDTAVPLFTAADEVPELRPG